MGFIKWNSSFSVEVAEVDNQHKILIGLANQLYDAMRKGKGREVLGPVLTELVNYTVCHFSSEERLFREYGYPEYEAHKRIHNDLTRKAKELMEAFDQGSKAITIDVMLFLSNWLNVHILGEDKKYGAFLNGKGVPLTAHLSGCLCLRTTFYPRATDRNCRNLSQRPDALNFRQRIGHTIKLQ